jgi:hypothetical protein
MQQRQGGGVSSHVGQGPQLQEIAPPDPTPFTIGTDAPPMDPEQRIYFYSPDEWERFIKEWAYVLKNDYLQVKRHGGSGDLGLDIIGLLDDAGLDGAWDCFQCKRYEKPLAPGDAYAEMYKIIRGVTMQDFTKPRHYKFLAPKGCGKALNRLLSSPSRLGQGFNAWLMGKTSPLHQEEGALKRLLIAAAEDFDFSIFRTEEFEDVLQLHRKSPYHTLRFGSTTLQRTSQAAAAPPVVDVARESVYVKKLIDVYNERHGLAWVSEADIDKKSTREHFNRQRECFFSAEDLRLTARDQVPVEVFTDLQQEVLDGVVEVEQSTHASGWTRLTAITSKADILPLTASPLIRIVKQKDRTGLCHQLANDDRLNWFLED